MNARTVLLRLIGFVALWWIVSEGTGGEWPLLVLSIAAATAVSVVVWPVGAWRWRVLPLLKFLPWFLRASLAGGWDVARRAFSRRMPLEPDVLHVQLQLGSDPERVFFAWTVSLLPGTASVALHDNVLTVHVLDRAMPNEQSLRDLESRTAALFR
jgi:multicomponent Na+:H+ antiporter subunit E